METIDIAIIGGGPAGLTAALYAGRARAKTVVFETALPGGQIITTDHVENYPAFPEGISGAELGDLMYRQAERFGAEFRTFASVEKIEPSDLDFVLTDSEGQQALAKAVILATGAVPRKARHPGRGRVHRPRRLLVRHVRRRAVPRQDGRSHRRRRRGRGGGALPDQVRGEGLRHPSPGRAPRHQVHPGALLREREDRDEVEPRAGRGQGRRRQGEPVSSCRPPTASRTSASPSTASSSSWASSRRATSCVTFATWTGRDT